MRGSVAMSIINMRDIEKCLNFEAPGARKRASATMKTRSRPASAAIKSSSRTVKSKGSRPASAAVRNPLKLTKAQTMKKYVPSEEKLYSDLKKTHLMSYSNPVHRSRVDTEQDAGYMEQLKRDAETYKQVDDQIKYKQYLAEIEVENERDWDSRLEMDRRAANKKAHTEFRMKELRKKVEQQAALEEAMEDRLSRKLQKEREKEEEREYISRKIAEDEAAKAEAKRLKKEKHRRLKKEANEFVSLLADQRLMQARDEREEEKRLFQFQQRKINEENAWEREKQRRKAEADRVTAAIRSKQKKSQDTRAMRDEELMLRHQREAKHRQLKKIQKGKDERERANREVMETRLRQVREKASQVEKEAEQDLKEYQTLLLKQQEDAAQQDAEQKRKEESKRQYKRDLDAQIADNARRRNAGKRESLRMEQMESQVKTEVLDVALEEARQHKLRELRKQGIPDYYARKLAGYQFKNIKSASLMPAI